MSQVNLTESQPAAHTIAQPQPSATSGKSLSALVARGWLGLQKDCTWLLALALVIGTFDRLVMAASRGFFYLNSDQAVVYLMGLHASNGELYPFFWGQKYGGTIEAILLGGLIKIFGAHTFLMPLLQIALALVATGLFWLVVRHNYSRRCANVAAALFFSFGCVWTFITVVNAGFHLSAICLILGSICVAQRWRDSRFSVGALAAGVLFGLACWCYPLAIPFVLPIALILVLPWRKMRSLGNLGAAAIGGVIGTIPLVYGWLTVPGNGVPYSSQTPILSKLWDAFSIALPSSFTDMFIHGDWPPLRLIVLTLAVVAWCVAVWRAGSRRRMELFVLAGITFLTCLMIAALSLPIERASYGLLVWLPIAYVLGSYLGELKWGPVVVVAAALFTAASIVVIPGGQNQPVSIWPLAEPNPGNAELIQYLKDHDRKAVLAEYWTAYLITAETNEKIRASGWGVERFDQYGRAARKADEPTIIVCSADANDQMLAAKFAGAKGVTREIVGPYTVYTLRAQDAALIPAPADVGKPCVAA